MAAEPIIRAVAEADAAAIAAIYAHHVRHGTASYDVEPLSVEETRAKIRRIVAAGWPFLVAQLRGGIAGYAYVTQFRDRAGYAYTCETSIYVRADRVGEGIGKQLLSALVDAAEAAGFRQIVGVIGGAEEASIRVHAGCGFEFAGRLHAVGWKHGRWLDNVYMQRALGPGASEPPGA